MLRIWLLECFSFGYLDFPFQGQLRRVCCCLLISRVLYVLHMGAICIYADVCTCRCVCVCSQHLWLCACICTRVEKVRTECQFSSSTLFDNIYGLSWDLQWVFGASWVFVFAGCWRLNLSSHSSLISTFWGEGINEGISHVQLKHSFWKKKNYNQGAAS